MRLRVFLCVVWGVFAQDSVFVSKTYTKAELDQITPNFMWQGEHALYSNKEVSTSFDGFQLYLPLSRYDISELSVFRGTQPASFTRNTAGAIAYSTGAYAKNISAAAIVNTSEIDAYGSNTIYGRVSGNIFDVASVYASIETNETLDWNPSYIDTKLHGQKSSEYKPNNGLENTKFFVKAKFDVLGYEPEVYFFNEDLNFSSYSHYFAKLNSEHNPYTERSTQFLGAKISKEIFGVDF